MESIQITPDVKPRSKKLAMVAGTALAVILAAYCGLSAYAVFSSTIWPGTSTMGIDVGGLTPSQAAQQIEQELPDQEIGLYLYDGTKKAAPTPEGSPDATITPEELGVQVDAAALAKSIYQDERQSFLTAGLAFFRRSAIDDDYQIYQAGSVTTDPDKTAQTAERLARELSVEAVDSSFSVGDSAISIVKSKDGLSVSASDLEQQLSKIDWSAKLALSIPYDTVSAKTQTAQEIHDQAADEMKNAGYDAATDSITPEQAGVSFDVTQAQKLLDAAAPGQTVSVPATIQQPAVTAEQLKGVLFRDKLGSYTTHVGGSAARISNVRLAAAAVNGTVLNSGDIFAYNEVVGQRTEARGYQAAPAYVQGETVDEIGGGVCQPSSTLYLATLLSNLEIVERYAHRYVPAYIPKGMDATVSWGGPEFRFRNNTDYPIKIVATYSKNYVTMALYGTKTDDTYVKMTNKVLSTTPYKTIYQEDDSLPTGTKHVSVTPYTGYKVETYRNLYSGDGTLISSRLEAMSDYKVRNEIIQTGPALPEVPAGGDATIPQTPADDGTQADTEPGTDTGTEPETDTGTDTQSGGDTADPQLPDDAIIILPAVTGTDAPGSTTGAGT